MQTQSANPLVQALAVVAALLLFTAALFVGAVVFLALLGLAAVAGVAMSLRLWWLRRQVRHTAADPRKRRHRGLTIEGEVVEKRRHRKDDT